MQDDDLENLADETTTRKVTLMDGRILEGALSRADDGIYNIIPQPTTGGVGGGLLEDISASDIVTVTNG